MSEQIPGVPEGYRLKGLYWGHELRGGEWCLNEHGTIFAYNTQWVEHQKYQNKLLPVLERIEPPKEPMRAESIPGVPEGYRLGRVASERIFLDGSREITFALVPVESEREAVLTLRLTDDLRKILYHPKGFWIKANGCAEIDLDGSCVEIRPKGATV